MKRLAVFLVLACTMFGAAAVRPQQLRSEYRVNPQGIDVTEPRLSWVLTSVNPHQRGLRHRSMPGCAVSAKSRSLQSPFDGRQLLPSRNCQSQKS